jgi:hypothetical protein
MTRNAQARDLVVFDFSSRYAGQEEAMETFQRI